MGNIKNLVEVIISNIKKAQLESLYYSNIFCEAKNIDNKNEFIFFLKPEITIQSSIINLEKIIELVLERINYFELKILNINVISAKYIYDYNIIAQHYGVINKFASDAMNNLSESNINKLQSHFSFQNEKIRILGGFEFISTFPEFNAYSLDYLWQNKRDIKIASGLYIEDITIDGEIICLINGFHPRQIRQYTEKGRSIVTFTLQGDISWKEARESFIGVTDPILAQSGSIRNMLLKEKEKLGIKEVSKSYNGCHLSAGPLEALIELQRYNSNFTDNSKVLDYTDFAFGRKLKMVFPYDYESIISNGNILFNGEYLSTFELTEEKDSDKAIDLLKKSIFK